MQLVRLYNPIKYTDNEIWDTLPGATPAERAHNCCIVCRERLGFVAGDDFTQVPSDHDSGDDSDYEPLESVGLLCIKLKARCLHSVGSMPGY